MARTAGEMERERRWHTQCTTHTQPYNATHTPLTPARASHSPPKPARPPRQASFKDLEAVEKSLKSDASSKVKHAFEASASRETMDAAVDVVTSMSTKLRSLEARMSGKVDAGDFEEVKMDALFVREKARAMAEVERKLKEVEDRSGRNEGKVRRLEGEGKEHGERIDVLYRQVERR